MSLFQPIRRYPPGILRFSILFVIVPCLVATPFSGGAAGEPSEESGLPGSGSGFDSGSGFTGRAGLLAAGLDAWRDGNAAEAAMLLAEAGDDPEPADLVLEDYRLYHLGLAQRALGEWSRVGKSMAELVDHHTGSRFFNEGLLALAGCRRRNEDYDGALESLASLFRHHPVRSIRRRAAELDLAVRLETEGPDAVFYDALSLFHEGQSGGVFPVIDFLSLNRNLFYELPFVKKVRPGDTLFKIASDCGCDLDSLISWNSIRNPDRIHVGDPLLYYLVPGGNRSGTKVTHVIKQGETLSGIAAAYGVAVDHLLRSNRIKDAGRIAVGRNLRLHLPTRRRPPPGASGAPAETIEPSAGFFLEAASRYYSRGSRVSALKAAEIGISLHPSLGEWPGMRHLSGRACMSLKRLTRADEHFVAAIEGAGDDEELRSAARLDRIEAAWRIGKHEKIPGLLDLLEKGSPSPDQLVRGIFFSGLSATDDGRTGLTLGLKKKMDTVVSAAGGVPGLGKACSFYWVIGRYFFHKELFDDAYDTFDRLAGFGNGYEDAALFWKGLCLARLNRPEEHDAIMTHLFEEDPFSYYGLTAARRIGAAADDDSAYAPAPGIVSHLEANLRDALDDARACFPGEGHLRKGLRLVESGILGHDLAELELGGASIYHANPSVRAVYLFSLARNSRFNDLEAAAAVMFPGGFADLGPSFFTEKDLFRFPLIFREPIERESIANELDPALVAALISRESLFQPEVISRAGAIGLMQIMPTTCRGIGKAMGEGKTEPARMFNPEINIRYGAFYLAGEIEAFGGCLPLALGAYNAGRDPINRWVDEYGYDPDEPEIFIDMIQYGETRMYVKKVLAAREVYARLYGLGLIRE